MSLCDTPKREIQKNSAHTQKKITRHKYGEYKNVLLSDDELEALKSELPDTWRKYIEAVSAYAASTGKKYKNFLATIRHWAVEDAKNPPSNGRKTNFSDFGGDDGMNEFEKKMLLRRVGDVEAEK